jgi:NADPH-dependent 2,4-dienoyl-CoA reductase/sulfur reductase-like enzyme
VYACGDVALAWRPSLSTHLRVEHWTSAAGQAAAVAHAIMGTERPYDEVPYFWSDQAGLRLQHVARTAASWPRWPRTAPSRSARCAASWRARRRQRLRER